MNTHPQTEEVRRFLVALAHRCFQPVAVDDGGDQNVLAPTWDKAEEAILGVDESTLYVRRDGDVGQKWVRIILGNGPGELASDYLGNCIYLDAAITQWMDEETNMPASPPEANKPRPAEVVAEALQSAEAEKEACEALISQAVSRYMAATGFRVAGVSLTTVETSVFQNQIREFEVTSVHIGFENDSRFSR